MSPKLAYSLGPQTQIFRENISKNESKRYEVFWQTNVSFWISYAIFRGFFISVK